LPPSAENACSKRQRSGVMPEITKRTRIGRPLRSNPLVHVTFVYGLPELNREKIKAAKYVASPGCFATTIELGLLPLARAGLLDNATVHVTGITGSSGSGIAPSAGTHHPSRAGNLKTYKPLEHQHVPEIVQTLADAGARDVQLRFVPVSAPLTRGIFATCWDRTKNITMMLARTYR